MPAQNWKHLPAGTRVRSEREDYRRLYGCDPSHPHFGRPHLEQAARAEEAARGQGAHTATARVGGEWLAVTTFGREPTARDAAFFAALSKKAY